MIRIDEIYTNTFWPWFAKNRPGTRLLFCDPPGRTDPDALFNRGSRASKEKNFVFFHDQEPVHLDIHAPLFDEVMNRTRDIGWHRDENRNLIRIFDQTPGNIVVSERGEFVDMLSNIYDWNVHYYFYHGWACQDWFRGYDKTFLIPRAAERAPTRTFMSPNRIVAGKRDHRVLFLYHVFKKGLDQNWISAPRVCAYENVDIVDVANKYCNTYSDITQVLSQADLPRTYPGESTQEMASCWLTNFDEAADSLFYVPTETVYFDRRLHITEKTFKAIALEMPFILMAPAGSLEYMREYGFRTFDGIIDESYDQETNDIRRLERVTDLLKELDSLTVKERQQIHQACLPAVEHNWNHFYNGGLTDVLWQELTGMLKGFHV